MSHDARLIRTAVEDSELGELWVVGGGGVKTKLKFDERSFSVEKFAAAVKEHGAALREIDLGG